MTGRVGLEPTTPDSSNQRKIFAVRIYWVYICPLIQRRKPKQTNKCVRLKNLSNGGSGRLRSYDNALMEVNTRIALVLPGL